MIAEENIYKHHQPCTNEIYIDYNIPRPVASICKYTPNSTDEGISLGGVSIIPNEISYILKYTYGDLVYYIIQDMNHKSKEIGMYNGDDTLIHYNLEYNKCYKYSTDGDSVIDIISYRDICRDNRIIYIPNTYQIDEFGIIIGDEYTIELLSEGRYKIYSRINNVLPIAIQEMVYGNYYIEYEAEIIFNSINTLVERIII